MLQPSKTKFVVMDKNHKVMSYYTFTNSQSCEPVNNVLPTLVKLVTRKKIGTEFTLVCEYSYKEIQFTGQQSHTKTQQWFQADLSFPPLSPVKALGTRARIAEHSTEERKGRRSACSSIRKGPCCPGGSRKALLSLEANRIVATREIETTVGRQWKDVSGTDDHILVLKLFFLHGKLCAISRENSDPIILRTT